MTRTRSVRSEKMAVILTCNVYSKVKSFGWQCPTNTVGTQSVDLL